MSILLQQASTRQLKSLAKRLQTVIASELNLPSLSLHQAQAIVAKGWGHADFHAAQQFHDAWHGKPQSGYEPRWAGPPELIVERLMQMMALKHTPGWTYWVARRKMITAVISMAWSCTLDASLSAQETLAALADLNEIIVGVKQPIKLTAETEVYLATLEHYAQGEVRNEQHAANWMDWWHILNEYHESVKPGAGLAQLKSWQGRSYPEEARPDGRLTLAALEHELDAVTMAPIWRGRSLGLAQVVFSVAQSLLPKHECLTRGKLMDAMNLTLCQAMAHDQALLTDNHGEAQLQLRNYLRALPYFEEDFHHPEGPQPQSEQTLQSHDFVRMGWANILR